MNSTHDKSIYAVDLFLENGPEHRKNEVMECFG